MKIFILDDDEERIDFFIEALKGHDLTVARSCKDAHKFTPPYDAIFLDHDLGEGGDGRDFISLAKVDGPFIVLHSWNSGGAEGMQAQLKHAHIAPFGGRHFMRLLTNNTIRIEPRR